MAGHSEAADLLEKAVDEKLSVAKLRELAQGRVDRPSRLERYTQGIFRMVEYGRGASTREKADLIALLEQAIEELRKGGNDG